MIVRFLTLSRTLTEPCVTRVSVPAHVSCTSHLVPRTVAALYWPLGAELALAVAPQLALLRLLLRRRARALARRERLGERELGDRAALGDPEDPVEELRALDRRARRFGIDVELDPAACVRRPSSRAGCPASRRARRTACCRGSRTRTRATHLAHDDGLVERPASGASASPSGVGVGVARGGRRRRASARRPARLVLVGAGVAAQRPAGRATPRWSSVRAPHAAMSTAGLVGGIVSTGGCEPSSAAASCGSVSGGRRQPAVGSASRGCRRRRSHALRPQLAGNVCEPWPKLTVRRLPATIEPWKRAPAPRVDAADPAGPRRRCARASRRAATAAGRRC